MAGRHISATDREAGMAAIVLADGNCAQATRDLDAAGITIGPSTLRDWVHRYPDELDAVKVRLGPQLEERRASRLDSVAVAAVDVLGKQMQRADETVAELGAKDAPGAARNTATVIGILTEKSLLLRQKPTTITQHDYSSAMKGLERMGLTIDGTGEEIVEAETVGELTA